MQTRSDMRFVTGVWGALAVLACMRAAGAALLPLSGDEAYYWEWSRRLAFGYLDHPPLVAWTIFAFDAGMRSVIAVRAGFLLCGVLAAFAAWDFAYRARGSKRAGALAALLVFSAPLAALTFGFATPDGPYLLAWTASLAFAQRALQTQRRRWWIALGVALGCSLLARFFGIALCAGMAWALARRVRAGSAGARGPLLSFAIALAAALPVVVWNAQNDWAGVQFALVGRHVWHGISVLRAVETLVFAAVAGALAVVPFMGAAAIRLPKQHEYWSDLAWCTAAPLLLVVAVLAFFEPVEIYWLAGPMLSLLLATAVLYGDRANDARRVAVAAIPSFVIGCIAAAFAAAPPAAVSAAFAHLPFRASPASVLEIYSYDALARDLRLQYGSGAIVTDGYGLSSVLDFYGGIPPIVVGYNAQGQEAGRWFHPHGATHAVYIDPVSLDRRPDVLARLQQACGTVTRRPDLVYRERATLLHEYSVTACRTFDIRSLAELNRR